MSIPQHGRRPIRAVAELQTELRYNFGDTRALRKAAFKRLRVPPRGTEHSQDSPANTRGETGSGTVSGTPDAHSARIDSDLRAIIERWGELPDAVKAGIVAMVRAVDRQ